MKKIFLFIFLFLMGCQTLNIQNSYDTNIFSIGNDVKISTIEAYSSIREKDQIPQVTVHGLSLKKQKVKNKIEWFDDNGNKIRTVLSDWENNFLEENLEFTWNMVAPSKKATAFKIYIQKTKN